ARQVRIGRQVVARRAAGQAAGSLLRAEDFIPLTDQIDAPFEPVAVDNDLDAIAVADLADWAAGERLRADVADAGARTHAGETRIRQQSHVLAEAQVLEGTRDLIDLLHAGAHGPAADKDEDVAGLDALGAVGFDGGDGGALAREDAGRAGLAVDAVGVDDRWIDGGALDDRAFRGQIAARKRDRARQAALAGALRTHDNVIGVD